jgi:hypothetical protein
LSATLESSALSLLAVEPRDTELACFLPSPLMVKKLVSEACLFSEGREGPAMALRFVVVGCEASVLMSLGIRQTRSEDWLEIGRRAPNASPA